MSISSSSNSTEKAIDEYRDSTSYNSSNYSTSHSSSGGSSTNEGYTSSVPSFPLKVIQEQIRKASRSQVGTSSNAPQSSPLDKVEITVYSCAIDIPSKTDEQRLNNIRKRNQISNELNPRLPVRGEWCCNPHFRIGVYEAYFLGGFKVTFETLSLGNC